MQRNTDPAVRPGGAASGIQASAGAGRDLLIGRSAIAKALGRSPRTVTRWFRAGVLPAGKIGPSPNNVMIARAADLDALVHS